MLFKKLSWTTFYKDCLNLGKKILSAQIKIDRIIAISRGGLVAARILSDYLQTPISNIVISSYSNLKQLKEPEIIEVAHPDLKNQTILIVDEVSDTGKTFQRALKYFQDHQPKKILTASPYIKPKTSFIPDFYIKNINAWIVFPYDLKETYQAFLKQEKNEKKAKNKLLKVGFKKWEVDLI
ncbi:MAG: phosphoribosyltransferase [Candidatus Microgenomates bacterium]